jgi:hypothetical protein
MSRKSETMRHILAVSGGKDSAALAVYLKDKIPDLEYVFLDTGHELPETYEFLNRMRAILGIEIVTLKSKRDFDLWLRIFNGCLPSPQNRWCTKLLNLVPYEHYIGDEHTRSYIALRADEDRAGYISHRQNVVPMYPFIEDGLIRSDIIEILEESGLGLPTYYSWRSRSGCYFCFFQRRSEWMGLHTHHHYLFEKACDYEVNHSDGRTYTWIEGESLRKLLARKETVLSEASAIKQKNTLLKVAYLKKRLADRLESVGFSSSGGSILDDPEASNEDDGDEKPCLICTL